MVKGVDLRSTAGHCAWVRTPQLTFISIVQKSRIPLLLSGSSAGKKKVEPSGFEPEAFRMQSERDTTTPRSQMYIIGGHCLQSLVCGLPRVLRLLTLVAHACLETFASLAQLVARRSHNPKVVSSILTGPILFICTGRNSENRDSNRTENFATKRKYWSKGKERSKADLNRHRWIQSPEC